MVKEQEEKLQIISENSTFIEGYEGDKVDVSEVSRTPEVVVEDSQTTEEGKSRVKKAESEAKSILKSHSGLGYELDENENLDDDYSSANKWRKALQEKIA